LTIKSRIQRLLGFRLGGSYISEFAIPPGWSYQRYLEIYGEVGWLFGAVSLIANSVADSRWKFYHKKNRKEYEEIDDHPILDLLNYVNPFQTRYQFLLMLQTYIGLVGEAFITLNFNRLKVPGEMWLAPPGFMYVVPSKTQYISHYEYRRGTNIVRLEIPEVIHIMDPNPANPYRGTGAARATSMDIDAEYYASRYQQRLFFNDATPGLILEFPDLPPAEVRKQLREEFLEVHQGWRNARKPAFLWGGAKANTIALAPKDMEFERLRNANKKLILGAYHIPDSLIGASEVGSRARAEADEYIFAKYTIKPALTRIKEALNEQLCPLFDENLELDFVSPVTEDRSLLVDECDKMVRAGVYTREFAQKLLGHSSEDMKGGTYLLPLTMLPETAKSLTQKNLTSHRWSEEQKELYWLGYKARTEGQEKPFLKMIRTLFDEQQSEVIENLKRSQTAEGSLFNETEANERFKDAFKPLIAYVYESAGRDVMEGEEPKPTHRAIIKQEFLNPHALEWIATRSLTLAKLLNGTTIEQLRGVLAAGFEAGESIPKITKRIEEYYTHAYKIRAQMVARTEVITASAKGAEEGYRELGVKKVQWYTALDERTCDECMALHDNIYLIDEGPRPALHPNCVLPDVRVEASNVVSGSRAFYNGQAIELTTEDGNRLTITPNHMILTPSGFMRAKYLHEGDYVITSLDGQRISSSINPDNNSCPAPIEDIWNSLMMKQDVFRATMPVSSEDFYGDAGCFDGDVDIIYPNSFLLNNVSDAIVFKHGNENILNCRNAKPLNLTSFSPRFSFSNRMNTPSSCYVGSSSQFPSLFNGQTRHPNNVSLAPRSRFDTSFQKASTDNSPVYTELSSQFQFRFASLIAPKQILQVRKFNFSGHVYDLQSLDQLYIANGIVVKNCRCVILSVIE